MWKMFFAGEKNEFMFGFEIENTTSMGWKIHHPTPTIYVLCKITDFHNTQFHPSLIWLATLPKKIKIKSTEKPEKSGGKCCAIFLSTIKYIYFVMLLNALRVNCEIGILHDSQGGEGVFWENEEKLVGEGCKLGITAIVLFNLLL